MALSAIRAGVTNMGTVANLEEVGAHRDLALAIIVNAVQVARGAFYLQGTPESVAIQRAEARTWLTEPERPLGLAYWAGVAGLDLDWVRRNVIERLSTALQES